MNPLLAASDWTVPARGIFRHRGRGRGVLPSCGKTCRRGLYGNRPHGYFRKEYGVSIRHLLQVAEPAHESRGLLIHIEPGERLGWCFHWDHDGAWELEQASPSFDAAIKALTSGIERRDTTILTFLGVYLD